MVAEFNIWSSRAPTWTRQAASAKVRLLNILCDRELLYGCRPRACSTAHRSNRPDHWDGLMSDRSAVKQLSSLSSRTKLPAGDRATPRTVLPAGNRCHFVLLDEDESCPSADVSNIWPSQWSGLFDRWAVEHTPDDCTWWLVSSAALHGQRDWLAVKTGHGNVNCINYVKVSHERLILPLRAVAVDQLSSGWSKIHSGPWPAPVHLWLERFISIAV